MRKDAKGNGQRIGGIVHKLSDEEGVENISMNRIVKELDIGMGTLYRHFKNKGDLCYYVIQRDLDIFITHLGRIRDDYHSSYEAMQVSLDYPLQSRIDHKALLQRIGAGNNKLHFYQSAFYQELFYFYYDLFKSGDDIYTKFKTDTLLQALLTRVFGFRIEHRDISVGACRSYLLSIYLDGMERSD